MSCLFQKEDVGLQARYAGVSLDDVGQACSVDLVDFAGQVRIVEVKESISVA